MRTLSNKLKLFIIVSLVLILYNEVLVYWQAYSKWPSLHDQSKFNYINGTRIKNLDERPVRLLLVADPQLIGENDEPWYRSWIARWDSDRYLKSSFNIAKFYTEPDMTIFLGDLFDEGLKSTDDQFNRYFERLKSIFNFDQIEELDNRKIFISGDNDVGGEYYGDRNDNLVKRFEDYFGPNVDIFPFNSFVKFIKLDLDYTVSFYTGNKRKRVKELIKEGRNNNQNELNEKFTIILNHMSILRKGQDEKNSLNKDSNSGLIIKGDSHLFSIIKYNFKSQMVTEFINFENDKSNFYVLNLNPDKNGKGVESVYELSVPTCSYRMGVPNMGYGVLTINQNGTAYVSILWLPSRFFSIRIYIFYLILVFGYLISDFILKSACKQIYFIITDKKSR